MAASKPRRVGLHEMASMAWSGVLGAGTPAKSKGAGRAKSPASGFQGAAIRPLIHGSVQVERDFSKPCECLTGDTVCWLWVGFKTLEEPLAGGIQRGRAASPLVMMVLYYKTHLAGADEWPKPAFSRCRSAGLWP